MVKGWEEKLNYKHPNYTKNSTTAHQKSIPFLKDETWGQSLILPHTCVLCPYNYVNVSPVYSESICSSRFAHIYCGSSHPTAVTNRGVNSQGKSQFPNVIAACLPEPGVTKTTMEGN